MLNREAAILRHPSSRRIIRTPLTSAGPNEVWCCDGHDKLCRYGFAIWGLRDKFSRKWLGLWVVPNNRLGFVVAYQWLSVVYDVGGKSHSSRCHRKLTEISRDPYANIDRLRIRKRCYIRARTCTQVSRH